MADCNGEVKDSLRISTTFFIVLVLVLVVLVYFTTPLNGNDRGFEGFEADGLAYGVMAGAHFPDEILKPHGAPWCCRVLTPYLVSLLPWSILQNFRFLAFVSNVLSLVVLLLILRRYGFSDELCLLGLLLYGGVFWALKFSFFSPAYIDFQTQLLLLTTILLTISQRYFLLIPILVVSALQKESLAAFSLYSVAHFLAYHRYRFTPRVVLHAASMVAFSILTVFLVRVLVSSSDNYSPTVIFYYLSFIADYHFWPKSLQAVFSGLGLLVVLPILRYGPCARFLRGNVEWVVYLSISILFLFGGIDKARLFLYMLPLVVVLNLHVIRGLKPMVSSSRFYPWTLTLLLIHLYMGGYLSPMGPFSSYLSKMVPMHSGWTFLPYLFRNVALASLFAAFTIWFIIGEWHFDPATGLTRKSMARRDRD